MKSLWDRAAPAPVWSLFAGSALGEAVAAMPWDLALPCSLYASCSCPFFICFIAQERLFYRLVLRVVLAKNLLFE